MEVLILGSSVFVSSIFLGWVVWAYVVRPGRSLNEVLQEKMQRRSVENTEMFKRPTYRIRTIFRSISGIVAMGIIAYVLRDFPHMPMSLETLLLSVALFILFMVVAYFILKSIIK